MGQAHPTLKVGQMLSGKYRVEQLLDSGGGGVIAAATHVELGKRVAIKALRIDADDEIKERFYRESRAVVRLQSEHVARVSDVGHTKDGTPFFVMELLNGEDLSRVIARGPMPIAEAVDLILQACEGLAEAHSLGIVHRDVKPRNLFLARQVGGKTILKILDFGIAKVRLTGYEKDLTATETVFGTPQYMSPEQMRASRNVDARTDIWSLGACLYELLAAEPPFQAETAPLLCVQVLTMPPRPLASLRPDVPHELVQVIERCLLKEPLLRFEDISWLAAALEPFAPNAQGAAERVKKILQAEPAPLSAESRGPVDPFGETRTVGSFDTTAEIKSPRKTALLIVCAAAALVLIGGITIVALTRNPTTASIPPATPSIVTTDPSATTIPPSDPPPTSVIVAAPTLDASARVQPAIKPPVKPPRKKTDAGPSGVF